MRARLVLVCLAALGAGACANPAVAEPEPTVAPTVALTELSALDTPGSVPPAGTDAPPTTVVPVPAEVAVIGDSLTVAAQDELAAALAALGVTTVTLDAVEGRRINHVVAGNASGVTVAAGLAATRQPDVWVVALGTNDVPGFGRDSYRADIEALLAELPVGAPVIWVDVWIKSRIDETRAANTVLREAAAGRPGTVVIDWFQFGDDPGLIVSDGIHLTDIGQQRFADQIAAAILQGG
ncbi:MAG TPA: GDSL-type esterase/lipase family protein [Ilumatobacter sp.]|nr:GDSL-type esterase/lipase family protein [Ilumatobacter sp.]